MLKDVPSDRHVEVMAAASKSGEVTAKAITKAAQEVDKPRVTAGPPVIKDELGITVTAKAMPIWSRRDEVLAMMKDLSRIKCAIEQAQEAGDLLFIEVCNSTLADLSRCREGVSYALPYTVFPHSAMGNAGARAPVQRARRHQQAPVSNCAGRDPLHAWRRDMAAEQL